MHADDRPVFDRAFRRLTVGFRLKLKPVQQDELLQIYFKAFEAIELHEVLAAAAACLNTGKKFPTVAEWLKALPGAPGGGDPDCRVMGRDELVDYHRAERLHYQDDPCDCLMCQAAAVTMRSLRFVPDFLDDGRAERALDNERNRVIVVGHWAHGEELRRWYAARAAFYASVPRCSPMARAVAVLVGVEREPGQEG